MWTLYMDINIIDNIYIIITIPINDIRVNGICVKNIVNDNKNNKTNMFSNKKEYRSAIIIRVD
jgi:hypothetical protein